MNQKKSALALIDEKCCIATIKSHIRQVRRAFTLIELLVVIVIIGILATISVAQFNKYQDKARYAKHLAEISQTRKTTLAEIFASGKSFSDELIVNPTLSDGNSDNFPDDFYPYAFGGSMSSWGYTTEGNFYFGSSSHASGIYKNGIGTGQQFIEVTYKRLTDEYVPLRASHNDWKELTNPADLVNHWYTRFVLINKTHTDNNVYLAKFHLGYAEYEISSMSVKMVR